MGPPQGRRSEDGRCDRAVKARPYRPSSLSVLPSDPGRDGSPPTLKEGSAGFHSEQLVVVRRRGAGSVFGPVDEDIVLTSSQEALCVELTADNLRVQGSYVYWLGSKIPNPVWGSFAVQACLGSLGEFWESLVCRRPARVRRTVVGSCARKLVRGTARGRQQQAQQPAARQSPPPPRSPLQ